MAAPALLVLADDRFRAKAHRWIDELPKDSRVTFEEPKRSLDQNRLLWLRLTDIAGQKRHHGLELSTEDWKVLFVDALHRESRLVLNLDGNGLVNLDRSTSRLSVAEMAELLTVIEAWGAREGVLFTEDRADPQSEQAA